MFTVIHTSILACEESPMQLEVMDLNCNLNFVPLSYYITQKRSIIYQGR